MDNLEKTLKDLGKLEGSLFRQVLTVSFIFPLLAVLAQYDKFAPPFHALTELLAGTLGAAGILSAYLDSIKNPMQREEDVLDFEPRYLGIGTALALALAAILFYTFYYFARQANEICLIFLGTGIFIFFRVLTVAVLNVSKAQLQRQLWNALDDETRDWWRQKKQKETDIYNQIAQSFNEISQKYDPVFTEIKNNLDEAKKQRRRERLLAPFQKLRKSTFPCRRKIGLVSRVEIDENEIEKIKIEDMKREFDEWINERGDGWHKHAISQIAEGKSSRLYLEGAALEIYEIGTWKYILLARNVNLDEAQKILTQTQILKMDEKGKLERVAAITDSSTVMTLQARDILSDAGIVLVKAPSDKHLTPIP